MAGSSLKKQVYKAPARTGAAASRAARPEVLFVHNNFPAQFGFLAAALGKRGWRCGAIGSPTARAFGLPLIRWKLNRSTTKGIYPLATRAEADLMRGRAAAECALRIKEQGFNPQLIIGHPGWGETLLLKEVFPKARQILHGEFYYQAEGYDVGFDPEFKALDQEERFRIAAKNASMALAYVQADHIVSPTAFQASSFPPLLRSNLSIVHEGIDTDVIKPTPDVKVQIENGPLLDRSTPVVTFINRNFEPLRGFHTFMRALPDFMRRSPTAHVILIGKDGQRGYGGSAPGGVTWKSRMLAEVGDRIDQSRIHFTGQVPHQWMLDAVNISAAHVYYTYPFVLSWSLLEAMASEAYVIASDTAPLHDAINDGVNGRLLNFFDVPALSEALVEACTRPQSHQAIRQAARRTVVQRFDRRRLCEPAWLKIVDGQLAKVA